MVKCDDAPLQKFVYSVTETDKVNNWSEEIHSITLILNSNISKEKNKY